MTLKEFNQWNRARMSGKISPTQSEIKRIMKEFGFDGTYPVSVYTPNPMGGPGDDVSREDIISLGYWSKE